MSRDMSGQRSIDLVINDINGITEDTIRQYSFSSFASCAAAASATHVKPKACDTENLKGAVQAAHSDRSLVVGEEMLVRLRQDIQLDMQALVDLRLSRFEECVQELLAQQTTKLIQSREQNIAEASKAELGNWKDSEATTAGQASGPHPAGSRRVHKPSAADELNIVKAPPAPVTLESPSQDDANQIETRPQEDFDEDGKALRPPVRGITPEVLHKLERRTSQLDDDDQERVAAVAEEAMHEHIRDRLINRVPSPSLREFLLRVDNTWRSLKEPERHGFLAKIEKSVAFFALGIAVVVTDQVLSVLATNYAAENAPHAGPSTRRDYATAEQLCLIWFAVELLLKILVHRLYFLIGENWKMNYLDTFLVLYSLVEHLGIDLSFLRAMRVFKMVKVVRVLKFVTVFHELRLMLESILGSFFTLLWAIVLVLVLCYMFALMMVQCMTDYIREDLGPNDEDDVAKIVFHFGSVQDAIVSLLMGLIGVLEMDEIYYMLKASGEVAQFATFFLVLFFHISVWNIIGSVYVDKVMALANPTAHERAEQARCQNRVDLYEIGQFFEGLDENGDGVLSEKEFMKVCDRAGLMDFLSDREIDLKENSLRFFKMAASRCGQKGRGAEVPIKEFTKLCQAVKGQASLLDVALLGHEMKTQFLQSQAVILQSQSNLVSLVRPATKHEWDA